jgi:hypothetical protein
MMPAFEVINPKTGHRYVIYADGRIEGFGEATVVINRILVMAYQEKVDTPSRMGISGASS